MLLFLGFVHELSEKLSNSILLCNTKVRHSWFTKEHKVIIYVLFFQGYTKTETQAETNCSPLTDSYNYTVVQPE